MHTNVRAALLSPKSEMTTVFFAALAAVEYDLETLAMDSEALLLEIEQGLGQAMPQTNRIKLVTAAKIAFTDLVYQDEAEFNSAAVVTHTPEDPPRMDVWELAEVEDAAWLLVEMQLIDTESDESSQSQHGNPFLVKRPDDQKPAPQKLSDQIWKFCGALLMADGCTRAISTLPGAIVTQPALDANTDPDAFASMEQRNTECEQDVAKYVLGRLAGLLSQLQSIPTAEGQPLVTGTMRKEWLAGVTAELLPKGVQPTSE